MPDTFFTASPHWGWYIVWYFFIGGIAGGAAFIAALLHFGGRVEDRPVVRLGFYVATIGAMVSGLLLTLDLTKPLRFWHMLVQSNTGAPMFKAWSPMSVGAWGLLLFGGVATLGALGALHEEGRLRWPALAMLRRGPVAASVAVLAGVLGLFIAGYTGVLLSVTNRPIWADSTLVGVLFLFSGGSTAAASLLVLARWRGVEERGVVAWLSQFDRRTLVLELLVLIAFVASLGAAARIFAGWWGVLLVVGVIGAGIVLPLLLESRGGHPRQLRAASLVLAGGLLLRIVVIFSSEQVHVLGAGVVMP